jgi:putative DNA methylase
MVQPAYPKRLIEVDLPIKRISAHARREKSIRHGHISTLHIWWARRPLAACRAVICAALWPDPADAECPQSFRDAAARVITDFAKKVVPAPVLRNSCSPESFGRWETLSNSQAPLDPHDEAHLSTLRGLLLDFIADFANWDNSTVPEYLETARTLTQASHEALGGEPGTRPLVVDPFAGGGSIPLEALRVGADAFASDLNPVAVLLNKVVLEYIPKYGQGLADEVRKWGQWIKEQAEKELAPFYPKDPDGATPIAYLWARIITCEGPGCGVEVPLLTTMWLLQKANRSIALYLTPKTKPKRLELGIMVKSQSKWIDQDTKATIESPALGGTAKRGSVTCPCCGYTTPVTRVREQLKPRGGGARDSRLLAVVTVKLDETGRQFRLPNPRDFKVLKCVDATLQQNMDRRRSLSYVPNEPLPLMSGVFNAPIYGHSTWGSLFTNRQVLALSTLADLVRRAGEQMKNEDANLTTAVKTCLALVVDRVADRCSSLCRYDPSPTMSGINNTFSRQALPMVWDFGEGDPTSSRSGGWDQCLGWVIPIIEREHEALHVPGTVQQSDATVHPLADDVASAFVTDPPYYNAVPYADLSDYFYVWLRRSLADVHLDLFSTELTPKTGEACQMSGWDPVRYPNKDAKWFEVRMAKALAEGRRVLRNDGVGVVVFAHKSTAGWESMLAAMIDAGWIITGSWPIDTEMGTRLRARASAALASSVHLVCRPRIEEQSTGHSSVIGDWRDVLSQLPNRIHEWMPRLASEGVVGADAIFACLGPALEIFSRYSHVEKASGERVALKDYLEHVWAAVAKEALSMIFAGADATGFDPDARLTAMWFWTLSTGLTTNGDGAADDNTESAEEGDEESASSSAGSKGGYVLEYDAARKIAQGLGAHLEQLSEVVEVKGNKARLLPVAERARHLFGKDEGRAPTKRKKKHQQPTLFDEPNETASEDGAWSELESSKAGTTVLDRLHQSMILFAAGRSEALKRFLVEEGVGRDTRYWRLAQALSALYPAGTEEKRWVDGVLTRKKGLGF